MTSIQFGGRFFRIPIANPGHENVGGAEGPKFMNRDQLMAAVKATTENNGGVATVRLYRPFETKTVFDSEYANEPGVTEVDSSFLSPTGEGKRLDCYADVTLVSADNNPPGLLDARFKAKATGMDTGYHLLDKVG